MVRVACLVLTLALGGWGCATPEPAKVAAPREEPKTFYYVSAINLTLKSSPDPGGSDAAPVSLNERVEQLKRSSSWFQVRTADGREGWANEKYLALRPVSRLYVRHWLRLKANPAGSAKNVAGLKANDQVNLLEMNSQGWARVSVAGTQTTGWLELKDLSPERVTVRRVRRAKAGPPKPGEEEAPPETGGAPGPSLGPTPAQAAPPPAKKAPASPKTRPEMFDPF